MKNKTFIFLSIIFLAIITLPLILAETGCCYDSNQGICSLNADKNNCLSSGGNWSSDTTCNSESKCDKGCCIAGNVVAFTTDRRCAVLSLAYGVTKNFNSGMTESQCYTQTQSNVDGACVFGEDNDCKITAVGNCSGTFYSGVSCTDVPNPKCKKTSKTMCYKEDVYFVDSCNNPDKKTDDCNYASGTICRESGGRAFCKSLNCAGGKKNGQSWCVGTDGSGYIAPSNTNGRSGTRNVVKSFGLTGQAVRITGLVTGTCRYKRINIDTEAYYCVRTNKDYTFSAVDHSVDTEETIKEKDGAREIRRDKCDTECAAAALSTGGSGGGGAGFAGGGAGGGNTIELEPIGPPVGSRFFRQYCLNSEIFTEPCADFRTETCVAGETETAVAKCKLNDWSACLNVGNDLKKCGELEQCMMWTPEINNSNNSLIRDLHLEKCIPKVAGGLEFYPKEAAGGSPGTGGSGASSAGGGGSSSGTGTSSASEMCGKASYASEVQFVSIGKIWYFKLDQEEKDYFGNAGLLLINKSDLGDYSDEDAELSLGDVDAGMNKNLYSNYKEHSFSSTWSPISLPRWVSRNFVADLAGDLGNIFGEWRFIGLLCGPPCWVALIYYEIVDSNNYIEYWGLIPSVWNKKIKEIPVNLQVVDSLQQRCQAIADCQGKLNWVGANGSEFNNGLIKNETSINETNYSMYFIRLSNKVGDKDEDGNYILKFNFNFTCSPWKAPIGASNCEKCGSDGLACSEYRCKALGKRCEHYTPEGVDNGICQDSDDNEPAQITLSMSPSSPVPPNSAVKILLSTNERAECKFDIGVAGTKYEEMTYNFAGKYTLEHNITLNVPGQAGFNDSESYALINRDGKYDVYVRCVDVVGNWNLAPKLLSFEVMETPDKLATILSNFNPESGSRITYGQTSKAISFKINEPAECKWSFEDFEYGLMENNFSCDTAITDAGLINGYGCTGTLRNITLNITEETKFYIRCKDQPWLEGNENEMYQRNTNEQSVNYILKPSPSLWIKNITPMGELKVLGSNITTTLKVITADGSNNGVSECYWSLSQEITSYVKFFNTNSATHTQVVNVAEGENTFYINCRDFDSRRNEINRVFNNTTFNVIIDNSAPQVILAYRNNQTGQLNIVTDEQAECRYNNNETTGCLFEFSNGTRMITTDKIRHSSSYNSIPYYIKCKDMFGFANKDTCGIILGI